ncbi:glycosyltransferase family 8 protein [Rhizobium nepotum]|jgi:lipopolysaccharide biosynthesis glycosyltransferase|uniref:glycosyltransferase family 8 protein n=1 Tax=Rhizobium nepotum TaxID=1035271 RepID=UPI000A0668AF|nr:glycosyltransferase [Rhizobium nepotum]
MVQLSERKRAAIYVSDAGFLYPTLVSASQLEQNASDNFCDILIYLINVDADTMEVVRQEFPEFRIFGLSDAQFAFPDDVYFKKDHVAAATLGRLVLYEHIPTQYEHIVYIDGDTQILGDVRGLLIKDVPPGKIAAGRGGLWLSRFENGPGARADRAYVGTIGTSVDDYFNAGVLALRRESLAQIGQDALRFFFQHSRLCRQHDQSALNAVSRGKVEFLWPGYNFHGSYDVLRAPVSRRPAIVHFTGPYKPWLVDFGPAARYAAAYDEFDIRHPLISRYRFRITPAKRGILASEWQKSVLRTRVFFWRSWIRRWLLTSYEKSFKNLT